MVEPLSAPAGQTVTLSPKYQVVIPRAIRERLGLKPGRKLQAVFYDNRIELIPVVPAQQARGSLAGIDTEVEREPDREIGSWPGPGQLRICADDEVKSP